MTLHVLAVDPPRPGLALPELTTDGGLGAEAVVRLAEALIQDAAVAAADSGGELLVYHPTDDQLPAAHRTETAPVDELRALLETALPAGDDVRFEPQGGSSAGARVTNAATHLLQEEDEASVAVLDGRAPTLDRAALDSAGMKLRRSEAVIGPAPNGRATYLGLTEPMDLEGAWGPPQLNPLVERAVEAEYGIDFLPMHPRVDGPAGLASVVALIEAWRAAGRRYPSHTAAAIDDLDLQVTASPGSPSPSLESTDRA